MPHFSSLLHPVLALACALPLLSLAADAPLKPQAPIEIPNSKGGFDFLQVDDAQRRLLLDHTGNGTLDVIDLNTGKVLKQIPTGAAQGVAIDAKNGRYFVAVSREKTLLIIDSKTLEKTGEVALPGPGDALTYSVKHDRVYVGHDDEGDLWVINPMAKKIVATVAIAKGPEYVLTDDEGDRIFQNIKSNDTVAVIDPVANTVKSSWKTGVAKSPHGLAFDDKTRRLFIAGMNGKVAVLSSDDGKVLGSVDTVSGVDQIALDAGNHRLYCPGGRGSLTVVDVSGDTAKAIGDVPTPAGAKTCTVDPTTHAVWTAYTEGGKSYARKFTP